MAVQAARSEGQASIARSERLADALGQRAQQLRESGDGTHTGDAQARVLQTKAHQLATIGILSHTSQEFQGQRLKR